MLLMQGSCRTDVHCCRVAYVVSSDVNNGYSKRWNASRGILCRGISADLLVSKVDEITAAVGM